MHYDPWWNPAVERQATDRAHRLGQRVWSQLAVPVYFYEAAALTPERAAAVLDQAELFAEELRLAQQELSAITGEYSADDLLGEIFSRFCIGK